MRDYTQESIESKYRADLEKLGSYSVIIPLDKGDIGCYIEEFDSMDSKDSNELCREVVNLLEFEIITMNNTEKNKANRFLHLVKEVTRKICRMNKLTFKDSDELFLLGQGDA
tara:strand:- start:412 stop:747 length:336 start_codon:yes stop_codon:yes gene_type:complete